jgi:hypothetical protein
MLLITVLLIVTAGTYVYRLLVQGQAERNETRAALSYVAARVRSTDNAGAVRIESGVYGTMLVLTEADTYETRFYWYEGVLLEEYTFATSPCVPENATQVAQTKWFKLRTLSPNLLEIETQQGIARVTVRSGIGGGTDV